jgi:hypothetical protein
MIFTPLSEEMITLKINHLLCLVDHTGAQKEEAVDKRHLMSEHREQIQDELSEPSIIQPVTHSMNLEECIELVNSLLNEKKNQVLFNRGEKKWNSTRYDNCNVIIAKYDQFNRISLM